MIINGDPSQIDLPQGQASGLVDASRILRDVEGVGRIRFAEGDVVRHDMVRRIVAAYDADLRARGVVRGPDEPARPAGRRPEERRERPA